MLFSTITPNKQKTKLKRKEIDSFLVNINMSDKTIIKTQTNRGISPRFYGKRASLCTSCRGSITVEAAMVLPLFFFALICIVYLLEIMSVQMSVRIGMHHAIEEIASDLGTSYYLSSSEIESIVIESIGAEKLDNSIIVDGSSGLDCSGSSVSILNGLVELEVDYEIQLPIPDFGFPSMNFQETMRAKGWTGYVNGVAEVEDEIVYVTANSSVYHVDYNCTHLQLSISTELYQNLESLRSGYGGTYATCDICIDSSKIWEGTDLIYVAEYGDCYHSTLSCRGLVRTIYAVSISEVVGKGVCSRCGS